MGGIVGIALKHRIQRLGRVGKAVLLVVNGGEIGARGPEPRRELQRARQQFFGIVITPDPSRNLGEHADCRDVGRIFPEALAQRSFGVGKPVLGQSKRGVDHRGVVNRRPDCGKRRRLRFLLTV